MWSPNHAEIQAMLDDYSASSVALEETAIFAGRPRALHAAPLDVNGTLIFSYHAACIVRTEHPLKALIVGRASGWILFYDKTLTFGVLPAVIEVCFGLRANWDEPISCPPITTTTPLNNWMAAQTAFKDWAQKAFEDHCRTDTPQPWPRRRPSLMRRFA